MLKITAKYFLISSIFLSGCDEATQSFNYYQTTFRFENFDTAEEAAKKLNRLFPKNSDLKKLIELFRVIGVTCYASKVTHDNRVECRYKEANDYVDGKIVSKKWVLHIMHGNNKIHSIDVKNDLIEL